MNMTSKSAEFAALIGIDWASQRHALCLYDCATGKRESSILEHTPEAIAQWARGLQERFRGNQIALCLEQTRGPLIYALLEYPFFVLYPINPATAARYRQAFKTSRAKDDPSDAQVCLEFLLHHREKLNPWLPNDGQTRELSCLLQHRRVAVDLRTLLTNMLRDALKSYYPQALELAGQDLFAPLGCQLPLKEYDSKIEQLFAQHSDALIWKSFPGAGLSLAPRLTCAFGSQRSRYQSAAAIQQYSGTAPVTEKSGKNQHWVHRRWARPHFTHQSFFEYASQSVLHCHWAKLYLKEQMARGKAYPTAIRALAFKWQRIMFVCWRDRVPYDETTYLQSLKRRGSHLARTLNQ